MSTFWIYSFSLLLLIFSSLYDCISVTKKIKNGRFTLTIGNKIKLKIKKEDGTKFSNTLYTKIPGDPVTDKDYLKFNIDCDAGKVCVACGNVTCAEVGSFSSSELITIRRFANHPEAEIIDCYQFNEEINIYGGPETKYQRWPVQPMHFQEEPFIPTHQFGKGVAERYLLTSKGTYLYIEETDPLFLDQNNYKLNHVCLIAKNRDPYPAKTNVTLNYEFGVLRDAEIAHTFMAERHYEKPRGHPDEAVVKMPSWTTWPKFRTDISDKIVRAFANEIIRYKFSNSHLTIDDGWESCYGSAAFDTAKFPNANDLIHFLKNKGFRIALWVHPFVGIDCYADYKYASSHDYLVKTANDEAVHVTSWRGNKVAVIDFTNPNARTWWQSKLTRLKALGIDTFKLGAGETSWLPPNANIFAPVSKQPGIFTHDYVNAAKDFGSGVEVSVGWRSQGLPFLVKMSEKESKWTWDNGLPTLVTTLIQMNLNGYLYVLPDTVGGSGLLKRPSKELYIRWLQASVFMPAIQLSYSPWDFDDETVQIARKFLDLHANYSPKILEYMNECEKTGKPLHAPVWWLNPDNLQTQEVNDEFILGEEILVAPIIEESALAREIYLPKGLWLDALNQVTIAGSSWIYYEAPLDVLPYFIKL